MILLPGRFYTIARPVDPRYLQGWTSCEWLNRINQIDSFDSIRIYSVAIVSGRRTMATHAVTHAARSPRLPRNYKYFDSPPFTKGLIINYSNACEF